MVFTVSVLASPARPRAGDAPGQQAHEHPLEHLVLPGDDPPDLEERLLEPLLRLRRVRWFDWAGHVSPFVA